MNGGQFTIFEMNGDGMMPEDKIDAVSATVDLPLFGMTQRSVSASIGRDENERASSVSFIVDGLTDDQINQVCQISETSRRLVGDTIDGVLNNGDRFNASIAYVSHIEFGSNKINLTCNVDGFYVTSTNQNGNLGNCGEWVFRLANIRIPLGDCPTQLSTDFIQGSNQEWADKLNAAKSLYNEACPGVLESSQPIQASEVKIRGGFRNNRVVFQFANRTWRLDDDLLGCWPRRPSKIATAVNSGILSTESQQGDSFESVSEVAEIITDILSLAQSRDIKWIACRHNDLQQKVRTLREQHPPILGFNQELGELVGNWEVGNLSRFIVGSEPAITKDPLWWSETIGLLLQVGGSKQMIVRCSLLNIILDRITTKIVVDNDDPEIDPNLNQRIDRRWFRFLLHLLLRTLSPQWEKWRTDTHCDNTIKGWNASPSFPKKIQRACEQLGIPSPSGRTVGNRHRILHVGEFDKKLRSIDQKAEYTLWLQSIVQLMLVKLLGFDGLIFLPDTPPDPKRVSEFCDRVD
ncbi:hypothetical protein FHS27_000869 [Rhodopirellula rubra]|uniref:Uncharacterized protein n=1 Tax=Aporhodopirellula rubra TaxID=980271 RepID=A0A7W5H3B4_9BACT|nr:hypothetical protein [Aporhodopirellula rubra]MBB3205102.1 hypothetical protein [Aporhodopirellula rubra]